MLDTHRPVENHVKFTTQAQDIVVVVRRHIIAFRDHARVYGVQSTGCDITHTHTHTKYTSYGCTHAPFTCGFITAGIDVVIIILLWKYYYNNAIRAVLYTW